MTNRTGTIKVPGRPEGLTFVSITGRPAIHLIYREVWADQVDNHGEPCPVCQLEDRVIECNVYVPVVYGDWELVSACRCCAHAAVLEHHALDTDYDAVIEYAKEK